MLIWVYDAIYHSENSKKYLFDIKALAFNLDIKPAWVLAMIFLLVTWFGWLLLPIKIYNKIIRLFKKED